MRLYTFTLYQLRTIQQGIQPLHVVGELASKYGREHYQDVSAMMFYDWVDTHKTVICLNGGIAVSLAQIEMNLGEFERKLGYPTASFHEDQDSLSGALTSVGIIVPERVYSYAAKMRSTSDPQYQLIFADQLTDAEKELAVFLDSFKLAE